jgi:hypothetical protein
MDTSILNLLAELQRSTLETALLTNISDETKLGIVTIGLWQDDPLMRVTVRTGNEEWRHERNTGENDLYPTPVGEIGSPYGTGWWRRRFVVEIVLFLPEGTEQDAARQVANVILSRAERTLETIDVSTMTDDFGETAHKLMVADSFLEESGGESQRIWRGQIRTEAVTLR